MSTRFAALFAASAALCSPSAGPASVDGGAKNEASGADAPSDAPTGTPVWKDLPFQVAGCTVQRLSNADKLSLFHWKACDGRAGCTEAVWNRSLIGSGGEIGRRTSVDDDGRIVRVGVAVSSNVTSENAVFVTLEDGSIQLGLRVSTAGGLCHMLIPTLGSGRFGAQVTQLPSDTGPLREGGLLTPLDDLSSLAPFEIAPLPTGSGPDSVAMGRSRWLWRFAPAKLTTFSNVDASGFTVFAEVTPQIAELGGPTSTGASFLFDVRELTDGGTRNAYIGRSDGVAPPERFISGSAGSWVGAPMFAHSHIGWQRGINPHNDNQFDAVELWASPYTENAAALAPYKVADLGPKSWGWMCAGFGRYATMGKPETNTQHDLLVWDLAKKTAMNVVLPPDRYYQACGLSRSAFWLVPGLVSSSERGLMRFAL